MVQFSSNNFGREEIHQNLVTTSEKNVQTQDFHNEPINKMKKLNLNFKNNKLREKNNESKISKIKLPLVESKKINIIFSIKKYEGSNEKNVKNEKTGKYLNFYEKIIAKSQTKKSPFKKPDFSYLKTENYDKNYLSILNLYNKQTFSTRGPQAQDLKKSQNFLDILNSSKSNAQLLNIENSQLGIRKNSSLVFSNKIVNHNIISQLTDKITGHKSQIKEAHLNNSNSHSLYSIQYRKNDFMKKMKELETKKENIKNIMKFQI
jgi:hypothetical protein